MFSPLGPWTQVSPKAVQSALRRRFTQFGRPNRLRVDNGAPWGSSKDLPPALALWLIGLGIGVIWNRPGHPQSNGVVERAQGLIGRWSEARRCRDTEPLQQRLDWTCQIQREAYPTRRGRSRSEAYPGLMRGGRAYREETEASSWRLCRVCRHLATGVWIRQVDANGRISVYNWAYAVGRRYAGQMVDLRFDAKAKEWVVADGRGKEIARHKAKEITKQRILALDLTRRKHKPMGTTNCPT